MQFVIKKKDLLSIVINAGYIFNIKVNYKLVKLLDAFSIISLVITECCHFFPPYDQYVTEPLLSTEWTELSFVSAVYLVGNPLHCPYIEVFLRGSSVFVQIFLPIGRPYRGTRLVFSRAFRAKRELHCIFLGKKAIIIKFKYGTAILQSLSRKTKRKIGPKSAR